MNAHPAPMKRNTDIKSILRSFAGTKVLIIGDTMVDAYLYGVADRISPEAPVPVVKVNGSEHRPGGAANVALNIKSLGAEPVVCTVCGNDRDGDMMADLFKKHGMTPDGILRVPGRPTTVKTRVLSHRHQLLRIDSETDATIGKKETRLLLDRIHSFLRSAGVVIFQDYDKGVLHPAVIDDVVQACNKRGIPTAVDPKKRNFLAYRKVTLFKPNLRETKEGLGIEFNVDNQEQMLAVSRLLRKELEHRISFITLSDKGIFVDTGTQHRMLPAHTSSVADVSGAGDTVISVAALGLASGLDMFRCAEVANTAAGIVCKQAGVVPVGRNELISEMQN